MGHHPVGNADAFEDSPGAASGAGSHPRGRTPTQPPGSTSGSAAPVPRSVSGRAVTRSPAGADSFPRHPPLLLPCPLPKTKSNYLYRRLARPPPNTNRSHPHTLVRINSPSPGFYKQALHFFSVNTVRGGTACPAGRGSACQAGSEGSGPGALRCRQGSSHCLLFSVCQEQAWSSVSCLASCKSCTDPRSVNRTG